MPQETHILLVFFNGVAKESNRIVEGTLRAVALSDAIVEACVVFVAECFLEVSFCLGDRQHFFLLYFP